MIDLFPAAVQPTETSTKSALRQQIRMTNANYTVNAMYDRQTWHDAYVQTALDGRFRDGQPGYTLRWFVLYLRLWEFINGWQVTG
jgi:hypothetical protein